MSEFHNGVVRKPVVLKDAVNFPAASVAVDIEWDKLKHLLAWDLTKVRPRSELVKRARKGRETGSFRIFQGHLPTQTLRACETSPNSTKGESYSLETASCTTEDTGQYSRSKEVQLRCPQQQDSWMQFPDSLAGRSGQRCGIRLHRGASVRSLQIMTIAEERTPTSVDRDPPPSRRPKPWDWIDEPVVPLEGNLYGHTGRIAVGHKARSISETHLEKVPTWSASRPSKITTMLVRLCG